ncbi:MAG: DUF2806 domain-containing protein [Agathobacter sp.]
MDPNTTLDTVGKVSEAVTKFQEIIQNIFGPKWKKNQTDADMDANERKLKMIRENPDMDIVFIGDEMHVRKSMPEALAYRAEQRMHTDAIRQERNLENVIRITGEELQQSDTVSNEPVDDDWITRLFSIVKDVNNEEMQYVWGKILAGEIIKPGSFSIRTLETIRNLSQHEAATFQKILPLIVRFSDQAFLTAQCEILKKYGVSYSDILLLDECGLTTSDGMLTINPKVTNATPLALFNKKRVIILKGLSSQPISFPIFVFDITKAGRELASILEYEAEAEYLTDFAEEIFKENKGKVNISIHNINSFDGDQISYKKEAIKVFETETDGTSSS